MRNPPRRTDILGRADSRNCSIEGTVNAGVERVGLLLERLHGLGALGRRVAGALAGSAPPPHAGSWLRATGPTHAPRRSAPRGCTPARRAPPRCCCCRAAVTANAARGLAAGPTTASGPPREMSSGRSIIFLKSVGRNCEPAAREKSHQKLSSCAGCSSSSRRPWQPPFALVSSPKRSRAPSSQPSVRGAAAAIIMRRRHGRRSPRHWSRNRCSVALDASVRASR